MTAPPTLSRPERGASAWLDRAACVVVALVVLDVLWAVPNPVGGHVRSGLSRALFGGAATLERVPLLHSGSDIGALLAAAALAFVFLGPGLLACRLAPESAAARGLLHVGSVPAVLGLLAGLGWAAGIAPAACTLLLAAVALGAPANPDKPGPWAVGLAGFLGLLGVTFAHAVYVSGPGMQPTLLGDAGPVAALGQVLGSLPTGPAFLVLGQVFAGACVLAALAGMHLRGRSLLPRVSRGPAAWLAPLAGLLALSAILSLPRQLLEVWRCPPASDAWRVLDARPGTFQLAATAETLWAVDRQGAGVRRYALPSGEALPEPRELRGGWPEEISASPAGLWLAQVPGGADGSVLRALSLETGVALGRVPVPGCFVASTLWMPEHQRLLLGCEYGGRLAWLDPASQAVIPIAGRVAGLGSVESLAGTDDAVFAAPLWHGDRLVRLDRSSLLPVRSRFVGDFGWGLVARGDGVALGRFQEGRVDFFDGALTRSGSVRVGFGVRDLETWDAPSGRRWMFALASGAGRITAAPWGGGEARSLQIGGGARDLLVADAMLYVGGRCGLAQIDLDSWLADR